MQHTRYATVLLLGSVLLTACKGEKSREADRAGERTAVDTVSQVEPTMAKVDSAPGVLARRREAEEHFEKARMSFVSKDMAKSAGDIRAAAAYFKRLRDSTSGSIQRRIVETQRELEEVAVKLENRKDVSIRQLDHAFARANQAEAERHLSRSADAWTRKDTTAAAEELIIAVDHLERASKDAGVSLDKSESATLADARRVGSDLLRHVPLSTRATMTRVQHDVDGAAQTLRGRISATRH